MVILARLIPPAAFGVFALATIVQELAINIPGEGIGSALVQRKELRRDHLQAGFALSLLIGVVLIVVTLLLAQFVVRPLYDAQTAGYVALATPWFLLGAILALPTSMLRRRLDFKRLAVLDLTQSMVRAFVTVLLAAAFGLDAPALILGGLAGLVAVVPLALVFARVPIPRWRTAAIREILPYGGPAALATVAWAGFRNGDYAVVGARLGAAQAGFYWRGFQLGVEYQRKISTVMTQIAFPVLSRTTGEHEMFALRRRMVRPARRGRLPVARAAGRAGAGGDPVRVRRHVEAGSGADPDPRGRRRGDGDHRCRGLGADGRPGALARCWSTAWRTSWSTWAR